MVAVFLQGCCQGVTMQLLRCSEVFKAYCYCLCLCGCKVILGCCQGVAMQLLMCTEFCFYTFLCSRFLLWLLGCCLAVGRVLLCGCMIILGCCQGVAMKLLMWCEFLKHIVIV